MVECKDCVHNKVCAEVNSLKCRKDFIWYDAKSGCPYYTADVVPKSEADNLIEVIDNTTQQFLELHDLYQNAKSEVDKLKTAYEGSQKTIKGLTEMIREKDKELAKLETHLELHYGERSLNNLIAKEKSDVAREIFEEIEKIDEDIASFQEFYSRIMRLKKKYTGNEG